MTMLQPIYPKRLSNKEGSWQGRPLDLPGKDSRRNFAGKEGTHEQSGLGKGKSTERDHSKWETFQGQVKTWHNEYHRTLQG